MVQRKQFGKMNRKQALENSGSLSFFEEILRLHSHLDEAFHQQFNRSLPFADEVLDRWERAKKLKFGEGSSIYDSSYVFGEVVVGKNTWIGPFTVIDGSGGLEIGDNCTISSGVHIYTHDNVAQTLSGGKASIEREKVVIGNCTYIGPFSSKDILGTLSSYMHRLHIFNPFCTVSILINLSCGNIL